MKKIFLLIISVIIAAGLLSGCQNNENTKITDYISFKPNTLYKYKGTGDERAAQTIYNDYINEEENLYQRRIIAGDMFVGECLSIKNGEMVNYFGGEYFYYFYDMTKAEPNSDALILKEPLKKGARWDRGKMLIKTDDADTKAVNISAEVTGENVEVTVPYGTFKALEITVRTENTQEVTKEYYVKDIGLVKVDKHSRVAHFEGEDNKYVGEEYIDITSELEEVVENTDYTDKGYFFYPDTQNDEVIYEEREIKHSTNEDTSALLEKELNNYSNEYCKSIIGSGTKINKIDFMHAKGKVKIDFSKELTLELAKDINSEGLFIQSIVNTIGYYFNMPKVCITVDGKGYEGNITMDADEYKDVTSTININNSEEE